jgi:segregation and condensation protein A
MVQLPSEFRPALDSYQGPLDLLLYLIKRDEVDVFDIPIARIVEQYQINLDVLSQVDPNACGEFLVVAAHLMEIKSKLLLPREELADDEEMEDPRVELVRQLLEYKKYKERSLLLERRVEEFRGRHQRPPLPNLDEVETVGAISLGNLTIWDIFTAFHRVEIALGAREPHRIVVQDRPIEEYVTAVAEFLEQSPQQTALFGDLFLDAHSREEAIGFLLAILEMAKELRLAFQQEDLFGPIEVRLRSLDESKALREQTGLDADLEVATSVEPAERFLLRGEGLEASAEPIDIDDGDIDDGEETAESTDAPP